MSLRLPLEVEQSQNKPDYYRVIDERGHQVATDLYESSAEQIVESCNRYPEAVQLLEKVLAYMNKEGLDYFITYKSEIEKFLKHK